MRRGRCLKSQRLNPPASSSFLPHGMHVTAAERDLLASFAALTYPLDSFGHTEHVRLAWTLLAEQSLLDAMCMFRRLLLAYAERHGAADKYNETITCIYLLLIREAMDRLDADHGWDEFQRSNPDLFGSAKEFLERWYPLGAAFAGGAKAAFRLPV
jgi:hypothetical protein